MASIYRQGKGWRVQVSVRGVRDSDTFRTKQEAAQWALQREAELSGERLPDKTLGDALRRYRDEVSPTHRGERWEALRLDALGEHALAKKALAAVTGADLAAWRDGRGKEVAPGTVAREMTLLRSVLEAARRTGDGSGGTRSRTSVSRQRRRAGSGASPRGRSSRSSPRAT